MKEHLDATEPIQIRPLSFYRRVVNEAREISLPFWIMDDPRSTAAYGEGVYTTPEGLFDIFKEPATGRWRTSPGRIEIRYPALANAVRECGIEQASFAKLSDLIIAPEQIIAIQEQ